MAKVWEKHDCNPFKSVLPLIAQAPLFIGFFGALRSMAAAKVWCCLLSPSTKTGRIGRQ